MQQTDLKGKNNFIDRKNTLFFIRLSQNLFQNFKMHIEHVQNKLYILLVRYCSPIIFSFQRVTDILKTPRLPVLMHKIILVRYTIYIPSD